MTELLPPERTGLVAVLLTSGQIHFIEAASFGEAASKLDVGRSSIVRFNWVPRDG